MLRLQAELPTLLRRTQIIVYLLVLLFRKNEIIKFAFYGIGWMNYESEMIKDFYFLFLNELFIEYFVHLLLFDLILLLLGLFLLIFVFCFLFFLKRLRIFFGEPRLLLLNPGSIFGLIFIVVSWVLLFFVI